MYKYLFFTWIITGFVFIAKAQDTNITPPIVLKTWTGTPVAAQQDTDFLRSKKIKIRKEKVYHPDTTHSPHRAVMRSLIVPGWGQVYNHKIWKVPLVYGGLIGFGWAYVYNAKNYRLFLALSKYRYHFITPGPKDPYYFEFNQYSIFGAPAIYNAKDGFRRDRDLCILGFVAFWGINTIDAYIDAKFIHSYTLDNNFTMRIAPDFISQPVYAQSSPISYIPGIKITFTL
jgi:hypothetical protein